MSKRKHADKTAARPQGLGAIFLPQAEANADEASLAREQQQDQADEAQVEALAKAPSPSRRPALVEARKRWAKTGAKTAYGNPAVDSGDNLAIRWRGVDLTEVYKQTAAHTGKSVDDLLARYGHLNPGSQRMNLGNLYRGHTKALARKAEQDAQVETTKDE